MFALRKIQLLSSKFRLILKELHYTSTSTMNSISKAVVLENIKKMIPPLTSSLHKGQAGRIAVIGGCKIYTGAPYFAAISSIKAGADMCYVFCTQDAAIVIKSYSPELMVNPILDADDAVEQFQSILPRIHTLVVGPGLGREETLLTNTKSIIERAVQNNVPMVIDADGVFLISQHLSLIHGYKNVILTPNEREFRNLMKSLNIEKDTSAPVTCDDVMQTGQALGNCTIVCKGAMDIISNGISVVECDAEGSFRRCGGQGDLLAGSMGTFTFWAQQYFPNDNQNLIYAAYAACLLTRSCAKEAFGYHGRSTLTSDMIPCIRQNFESLFGK